MALRPLSPARLISFFSILLISFLLFDTNAQGQVWHEDNNVWAYNHSFAKRFGFDPEKATDDLQGAYAMAIQLIPLDRPRCHQTGDGEVCVPSYQWVMDLYIDINQNVGIEGSAPRQHKPWLSSLYFLAKRDPSLKARWEDVFGLKGGKLYLLEEDGSREAVHFDIYSYKRPVKDGILLIQALINDDIITADPKQQRIVQFEDASGTVLHTVFAPQSYWLEVANQRKKFPSLTALNWQGGEEQDPNIWTYTKAFAEQYNLSPEWISEDMEGAMAIAFRVEALGPRMCGYFGDPSACHLSANNQFDLYMPQDAKVYYAHPSMDNFYGMDYSSDRLVNKNKNYNDLMGPVQNEGILHTTYVYRYPKRILFDLIKTKEMTGWSGMTLFNDSYLQPQVLQAGFAFAQFDIPIIDFGAEQYIVLSPSNEGSISYFYTREHYKIKLTNSFMNRVKTYIDDYKNNNGSFIEFVEKGLQNRWN